MQQIIILFFLFFITAYWIDSVRVKELARQAGKLSCKKHNVQLLDNTVVKQKTVLKRHPSNLVQFERHYSFEFSYTGEHRDNGVIIMSGHRLSEVQMDLHTYDNQEDA